LADFDLSGKNQFQVRFVAVSATIPNAQDIADWLGNG
jgi:replicative superfamily II helicase